MARRYVLSFLLTVAFSLTVLAGFNITVDAYDVFATLHGKTVPIRGDSARMSKAWALRARQPDCLILGTSRSAIGYRTTHPAWHCEHPYNGGLPKGHLYEVRRYLEHAIAQGQLKQVFIGLDFELFRNNGTVGDDFDEARMATSPEGESQAWPFSELMGLALSFQSTRTGLQAVTQWGDQLAPFEASGDWSPESLDQHIKRQAAEGTGKAARILTRILINLLVVKDAYAPGADGRLAAFAELEKIFDLCEQNNIKLTMVVNPVHGYYHELLAQLGLDDEYRTWKQQAGERIQARLPAQRYWNFDFANSYTLEPLPEDENAVAELKGFWDPSHYRRSYGDAVMQLALSTGDGPDEAAALQFLQQPAPVLRTASVWDHHDAATQARISDWISETGRKPILAASATAPAATP